MGTSTADAATTPCGMDNDPERRWAQRDGLRLRHAQSLIRLMASRDDLRGVHALADLVDESVRWSA